MAFSASSSTFCTTVTDEQSKARKSCADGLGRVIKVLEAPSTLNYETDYTYDGLDNLTCAEQHGNVSSTGCSSDPSNDATSLWRIRRFQYDSLSRLTSAKNPESGTIHECRHHKFQPLPELWL